MTSAKRLGGIGSRASFYDLSEEYALIKQGTVTELHEVGLAIRDDNGQDHLIPFVLFVGFVPTECAPAGTPTGSPEPGTDPSSRNSRRA